VWFGGEKICHVDGLIADLVLSGEKRTKKKFGERTDGGGWGGGGPRGEDFIYYRGGALGQTKIEEY